MEDKQQRPNYYILLGLPYDPPEMDVAVIESVIHKKNDEWNRLATNPRKGQEATRNRSMLPNIRKVLLTDDDSRLQEALNAQAITKQTAEKDEKEKNEKLIQAVEVMLSKGSMSINETDIEYIIDEYQVTRDEIIDALPEGIVIEEAIESFEISEDALLSKDKQNKISKLLQDLGVKPSKGDVPTLYDFMEVSEYESSQSILALRNELAADLQQRPVSVENSQRKDLCGYVKTIFDDELEREKYDNSLQRERFEAIESQINIAGKSGYINLPQYQGFISKCIQKGLTEQDADKLIKSYCHKNNFLLVLTQTSSTTDDSNVSSCPKCGKFNNEDDQTCERCGMSLVKQCIKCHTVSSITKKNCPSCNLNFDDMERYENLILQCKEALILRQLNHAERNIKRAILIADTDEVKQLSNDIKRKKSLVEQITEELAEAIEENYYFKAQNLIEKAKAYINIEEEVIGQYVLRVQHQIEETNNQLTKISQCKEEERAHRLLEILSTCRDSEWAISLLETQQPTLPEQFQAFIEENAIKLQWKSIEPEGNITYQIYRTEGTAPRRIRDGQLLVETTNFEFIDYDTVPNKNYWYSIFASRKDVRSNRSSVRGPLIRFEEAEFNTLQYVDEHVHIEWEPASNTQSVIVKKQNSAAKSVHDGEIVYRGTNSQFIDENVQKGHVYFYTIFSVVSLNEKEVFSNGVSKNISLVSLSLMNSYEIQTMKDHYQLTYKLQEILNGDIKIFKNEQSFNEQVGILQNYKQLMGKYKEVAYETQNDNCLIIRENLEDQCIMVVTTDGNNCLIGRYSFIKTLPVITDIDVKLVNGRNVLTWEWPTFIDKMRVKIATDRITPETKVCMISKEEYDVYGGYLLDEEFTNSFVVEIIMIVVVKETGQILTSKSEQQMLTVGEKIPVKYEIIKSGLFSKKYKIRLSFDASVDVLPQFKVVAKRGALPLSIEDGTAVFDSYNNIPSILGCFFDIDVTRYFEKNADVYFRIFFTNVKQAKNYELKPVGNVKI